MGRSYEQTEFTERLLNSKSRIRHRSNLHMWKPRNQTPLRTIDLFAGCGGLTLGLHEAGHQVLFAIEKDPMAFETFEANFLAASAAYRIADDWPEWLERKNHDIQQL